jgi:hypothetical protein
MDPERPHSTRALAENDSKSKTEDRSRPIDERSQPSGSADPKTLRELIALAVGLKFIFGTAVAVDLALRKQNADQDVELADCLRYGVANPAALQMERAESLVKRLGGTLPRALP